MVWKFEQQKVKRGKCDAEQLKPDRSGQPLVCENRKGTDEARCGGQEQKC